jgi:hypothetical protein
MSDYHSRSLPDRRFRGGTNLAGASKFSQSMRKSPTGGNVPAGSNQRCASSAMAPLPERCEELSLRQGLRRVGVLRPRGQSGPGMTLPDDFLNEV